MPRGTQFGISIVDLSIMINTLCIIGVGLIGGSFAHAVKRAGQCKRIVGYGRNKASLEKAVALGAIDAFSLQLDEVASDADVILLATPLGAMADIMTALKDLISEDTIITDVGSAKACVLDSVARVFGSMPQNFVAGHPIAGTENSGVEAAFPELFANRRVILTPTDKTSKKALATVRHLWESTGAMVTQMDAKHHDEVLAATSHLPHVLAFTLVDTLAQLSERQEIFEYAAGGFRDFTRIASSDPLMWQDICIDNKNAILKVIQAFEDNLQKLKQAIKNEDSASIRQVFQSAKQARDEYRLKLAEQDRPDSIGKNTSS